MNIRWLLIVFGLTTAAPALAAALSFDCKAAKTPVETAVCDDDALAALDAELSTAFSTAYKGSDMKEALLAGQRTWLAERKSCTTKDPGDANRSKALDCLRGRYTRRGAFLKRPMNLHAENVCHTLADAITFANGYADQLHNSDYSIIKDATRDALGALTVSRESKQDNDLVTQASRLDTDKSGSREYYVIGSQENRVVVSNYISGTLSCQYSDFYVSYHIANLREFRVQGIRSGENGGCYPDYVYFGDVPSGSGEVHAAFLSEVPSISAVSIKVATWKGTLSPPCELKVEYKTKLGPVGASCEREGECADLLAHASDLATAVDHAGHATLQNAARLPD